MKTTKETTKLDREILAAAPDGWFAWWKLQNQFKRARYRCERLYDLGHLERRSRMTGGMASRLYPITEYRKKP